MLLALTVSLRAAIVGFPFSTQTLIYQDSTIFHLHQVVSAWCWLQNRYQWLLSRTDHVEPGHPRCRPLQRPLLLPPLKMLKPAIVSAGAGVAVAGEGAFVTPVLITLALITVIMAVFCYGRSRSNWVFCARHLSRTEKSCRLRRFDRQARYSSILELLMPRPKLRRMRALPAKVNEESGACYSTCSACRTLRWWLLVDNGRRPGTSAEQPQSPVSWFTGGGLPVGGGCWRWVACRRWICWRWICWKWICWRWICWRWICLEGGVG